MDSLIDLLQLSGVDARPTDPTVPENALTLQRSALRPSTGSLIGAGTVLVAGPDGAVSEGLRFVLGRVGVRRVVRAGSLPAVRDLMARGVIGDLALVSVRCGADTNRIIRILLECGWRRVMVCGPTGAPAPVISAVLAGATGVFTEPRQRDARLDARVRDLTERQLEVLTLVADGCTNKEIASRMSLSAFTIRNTIARIGEKLETGDRARVVALACRAGVIT